MGLKTVIQALKFMPTKLLLSLGIYRPFWWLTLRSIRNVGQGGESQPRLLALNHLRFRGELESLCETGSLSVSFIEYNAQCRFLKYFYGDPIPRIYELNRPASTAATAQKSYHKFLMGLLSYLQKKKGITGIVTAHFSYISDYDWGCAAEKLGIPWFVLLRGGLVAAPKFREDLTERFARQAPFPGSLIVAHNEEIAKVIVESGMAPKEKVPVLGAGRFDSFVRKARSHSVSNSRNKRPKFLLCSFPHSIGLTAMGMNSEAYQARFDGVWSRDGYGFVRLFEETHAAAARIAQKYPEFDVVIKTKWGHSWIEHVQTAIRKHGMEPDSIPNLTITESGSMQELILSSQVVCSFGSTTLLESAIANVPTVAPWFAEAQEPTYDGYVLFSDTERVFERAHSPQDLEERIVRYLKSAEAFRPNESAIIAAYERFIGPVSGKSIERIQASILSHLPSKKELLRT